MTTLAASHTRFAASGYKNFRSIWSGLIAPNMGIWMQNDHHFGSCKTFPRHGDKFRLPMPPRSLLNGLTDEDRGGFFAHFRRFYVGSMHFAFSKSYNDRATFKKKVALLKS